MHNGNETGGIEPAITKGKTMYQSRQYLCDNPAVMSEVVNLFLNKTKRARSFGNFKVTADRITYQSTGIGYQSSISQYAPYAPEVIATRIEREGQTPLILGNSSILPTVGCYSSYGNTHLNRKQTLIQRTCARFMPMLPFSVFAETGLDINQLKLIEQGPEETVNRKITEHNSRTGVDETRIEKTHFTGASLFKLGDQMYLFDIDRNEIKHDIFNPFVAALPKPVKTIAEAYLSLKPKQVIAAEKQGLKVLRQGEWFFIPVKGQLVKNDLVTRTATQCRDRWGELNEAAVSCVEVLKGQAFANKVKAKIASKKLPIRYELKAGPNRPNYASMGITKGKSSYVSGVVSHSGREHADLDLGGRWYQAIPNTATKSFTITGDVD